MLNRWRAGAEPGVAKRHFFQDGLLVTHKVQDVEPILHNNRRVANDTDGRTTGGGRKIGSIPATLYHQWVIEWTRKGLIGPGNMERLNDLLVARLRDAEYAKLRTTHGSI